jgi:hypothetical protein
MLDQWEETKRAVPRPLHEHPFATAFHLGLDERPALSDELQRETVGCEERAVGVPGCVDSLAGVMEQIDVPGHAGGAQELVEGGATGEIAHTGGDPMGRYEAADLSLELGEYHRSTSAALRNASRSPWRWMYLSAWRRSSSVFG